MEVEVAPQDPADAVAFVAALSDAVDSFDFLRHGFDVGIVELVSSQHRAGGAETTRGEGSSLAVTEGGAAFPHPRPRRKDPGHRVEAPLLVGDPFGKVHETAALGIDRAAAFGKAPDLGEQAAITTQFRGVQLGIAAAEVETVQSLGKPVIADRAEKNQFGSGLG